MFFKVPVQRKFVQYFLGSLHCEDHLRSQYNYLGRFFAKFIYLEVVKLLHVNEEAE